MITVLAFVVMGGLVIWVLNRCVKEDLEADFKRFQIEQIVSRLDEDQQPIQKDRRVMAAEVANEITSHPSYPFEDHVFPRAMVGIIDRALERWEERDL